ncbi:MAG: hypothetical protein MJK04_16180, partial [Psychrosphaera sp.]|nr:hypothetical protein [Psychrosphaera sp.]
DADQFIDALKQILPLLRSSDFAAEDQLPTLVKLCAQSDYIDRVNQIAEEVDNIEYESAFDIAIELLAEAEGSVSD